MFNKTALKFSGVFLLLSIFNLLVIYYYWFRCSQTHSPFYCDSFAFGGIFFLFGIPALILLVLSIVLLITSRFYRNEASSVFKIIFIILGLIIFTLPYIPLFLPSSQPKTYSEFNARRVQYETQSNQAKEQACARYKVTLNNWKEGQPMPTPPSRDCN